MDISLHMELVDLNFFERYDEKIGYYVERKALLKWIDDKFIAKDKYLDDMCELKDLLEDRKEDRCLEKIKRNMDQVENIQIN